MRELQVAVRLLRGLRSARRRVGHLGQPCRGRAAAAVALKPVSRRAGRRGVGLLAAVERVRERAADPRALERRGLRGAGCARRGLPTVGAGSVGGGATLGAPVASALTALSYQCAVGLSISSIALLCARRLSSLSIETIAWRISSSGRFCASNCLLTCTSTSREKSMSSRAGSMIARTRASRPAAGRAGSDESCFLARGFTLLREPSSGIYKTFLSAGAAGASAVLFGGLKVRDRDDRG